jgi:FlaA1/EpsC-like NDP-sugar epimerase
VRDLLRQANQEYSAIGFVDDNVQKRGHDIHGVRVLGHIRDIPRLCRQYRIDLIFIALPSLNAKNMRRVIRWCEKSRLPIRTLPSLTALAKGHVSVNALRRLSIEDLLGREPVNLAFEQIHRELENKRIMVTGGGGSIGSELCRQIAEFRPASLLIVDNSEYNLYAIEIVDTVAMQELFAVHRPQVVFHAAAYKHVPMLESQIRVAVFNNILGTYTVAQLSHTYNVEKFILISTDKAVNPTNIMGATKRAAEVICQSLNDHSSTAFITVRFGNVLGSVGSVVPLFTKQIEQGGPVTVTHPDITRYFMTIPEACQLILQSGANGEGSEIFVLDMGEPIKITYLAQQMIRLAGKEPGLDISIVFTGLRPGEKIFEELFYDTEALVPTVHDKIYKAQCNKVNWAGCEQRLAAIEKAVATFQEDELLVLLQEMVPEYQPRPMKPPIKSSLPQTGE